MKRLVLAALLATCAPMTVHAQPAASPAPAAVADDPFTWLEDVEGEKSLTWVRERNQKTLSVLQADARYQKLYDDGLAILEARDRIPAPTFRGTAIDNYWQDATNVRGLWRRTTLDSYRSATPTWETVLDVDALAKAENANWVYKGVQCLSPDERLCLVNLSNGGKDAVQIREFDASTKSFVQGGFNLPEAKHRVSWLDKDTLLVASDFGPGTLTASGYPFVVKALKRGQTLAQAKEVYRGAAADGGYGVSAFTLQDPDGKVRAVMVSRPLDTFETEYAVLDLKGGHKTLPITRKASVQGYVNGRVFLTLDEAWGGFAQGALIAFDVDALNRDPAAAKAELVLQPTARQSITAVGTTRTKLIVNLMDNVRGSVLVFDRGPSGWSSKKLALPENATIGVTAASEKDDRLFANVTGYLQPSSLWLADVSTGAVEKVKSAPARFDASNLTVEQFEATSKDGTRVPYFVVHRKDIKLDGSNPTLLYAYGGFQVPMTPAYSGTLGKLWLERGGVYVLANIRGGGEFGPAWHEAGIKANRQRVYDDFHAVAESLIAKKITSPRRLGIQGGSNGGLLMGVALTQRPDLFNAVVVQVPLFDMIRYNKLLAGASWMGEYGNPDIPEERAWILGYSPYQALKAGQKYPEPFFLTSTKDDRVHPAHARKAAARMEALGYPFYYYENTDGGHSAAANLKETAKRQALEFTYLTRKLMD